jgi:hypothetical protein
VNDILIGSNDTAAVALDPHCGHRHGMNAGATGTGKTVWPMVLAEGFSRLGTPMFMADVKGDIAGMSLAARQATAAQPQGSAWGSAMHDAIFGTKRRQDVLETMAKQTVRTMGSQLGRQILRGVLGGIVGGR